MQFFGDVYEKTLISMFLTMFEKTQNIAQTMLIAHPYTPPPSPTILGGKSDYYPFDSYASLSP